MNDKGPPAREVLYHSKRSAGHRPFEAQGGIPTSAEVGKRNFFQKVSFETSKTFLLLLSFVKMKISEPFGSEIDLQLATSS